MYIPLLNICVLYGKYSLKLLMLIIDLNYLYWYTDVTWLISGQLEQVKAIFICTDMGLHQYTL